MNKTLRNICIAILLLVPCVLITNTLDPDIWFMLNHGRYILSNGFVNIEPFTVHQGLTFSFEKWLTCITFWKTYDLFGAAGLYILNFVITYLTAFFLYKICYYVSNNWKISLLNTNLLMIPFILNFSRTRPQIFSCLIMTIEVLLLEKWVKTQNHKYLIGLPILSWLFMQTHSTMWPMFFIMIMPYLFDLAFIKIKRLQSQPSNKLVLIICLIVCLAVGFINPYGYKSVVYLIKSLSGNFAVEINELSRTTYGSLLRLSMVIFPQLYFMIFTDKKLPLRYGYFIVGTTLMMLVAVRNQAFYLLFAGFITAYMFKDINIDFKFFDKLVLIGSIFTILLVSGNCYWRIFMRDPYKSTDQKPIIDKLIQQDTRKDIKMFSDFDNGDYLEYVGIKAYIDARAEVFIPEINEKEDILLEYDNVRKGKIHYQTLQDKYNFDYWLVYNGSLLDTYISKDDKYQTILQDDIYTIYAYQN